MIINFLGLNYQLEKEEVVSIKKHIKKAKYSIWLKNVWFTHNGIKEELFEQIKQGLSVHIILSEEFIETYKDYLDFDEFVDMGGELFILPTNVANAIKPTQFMLIDNQMIVQNSPDSKFAAETKDLIKQGWTSMLIKAYTDWFLYLERLCTHYLPRYFFQYY